MQDELIVDVGGSHTRIGGKTFASDPDHLLDQIKIVLKKTKNKPASLRVGIRGVWTNHEKAVWRKKLRPLKKPIDLTSDVELAYEQVFKNRRGILINAGTGSIAYGRNNKSIPIRAGGLGPLLGDEGSAFWIGREYLKRRKLKEIRRFLNKPNSVSQIAKLGFKVASSPKRYNAAILIIMAYYELFQLIRLTQEKGKIWTPVPLALAGGLFKISSFKKGFLKHLKREKFKYFLKNGSL